MLPTEVLLGLALVHAARAASKSWVSLPVHGPDRLHDFEPHRHQVDAAFGTPPQNTSIVINIGAQTMFALTPKCVFCPPDGMYDPDYSSSAKKRPETPMYGDYMFGGSHGNETVTFGGVLQDVESPVMFIEEMATDFEVRFTGGKLVGYCRLCVKLTCSLGHLGLFVPQANETKRQSSVLVRMEEQGQLLNPVWGLRMTGENPRLTIGALDPDEYQGEINWVSAVDDQPMIKVDAVRGYQGNVLPLQYPINGIIDTFSKNIYLSDLDMFMLNTTFLGPQEIVNIYPPANVSFGVPCANSESPDVPVEFSVDINGVNYPVKQTDLVRKHTGVAADGMCNVGIRKDNDFVLGITFLRSVYLAYRFPTGNCPGYWGFAIPKGSPAPTSTQKPRVTPTDAGTCLSFSKPNSTPTPTIAVNTGRLGSDGKQYNVEGISDKWVELRNVDELPLLKVNGGTFGFNG